MNKTQQVILIDDHHLVRAGLRSLIEDISGYEVVAEGSDGDEAIALLTTHSPHILMMDIAMKRLSGLDALPIIKEKFPGLAVILLSMHASSDYVKEAFSKGAQAYLLKDSAEIELELAFAAVKQGEKYVSPKVSQSLLDALDAQSDSTNQNQNSASPLTIRQIQILRMIALGKGTKEIAYELNLSVKTVESHRSQIMERLDIRDVASLVRYAIKQGIISLDSD